VVARRGPAVLARTESGNIFRMVDRRVQRAYDVRFSAAFADFSPEIPTLSGVVDMHAHGHEGGQDPLAVARLASQAGMGTILWKTLVNRRTPWLACEALRDALARWADTTGIPPVRCAFGATTDTFLGGPTLARVREMVAHGAAAIWLPVITHVNSMIRIGAPGFLARQNQGLPPMSEERARALGGTSLVERGRVRPEIIEVCRFLADHDVLLFFGHAPPEEVLLLAEELSRMGFRKAVVDHPLSQVTHFTHEQLRSLVQAGVFLNWTYDELSPMLGVDPQDMVDAIQAVGPEHCVLSSDAGDPVLPHTVECMRLMLAILESYGLSASAVRQMAVENPSRLLNLPVRGEAWGSMGRTVDT
jgi:hypothetical protein